MPEPSRNGQVSSGNDSRIPLGKRKVTTNQVARQLVADKPVIGDILVEGIDNPVSIAPGMRQRVIAVLPGGVGIPHHIQPVPTHVLAVVGRGEKRLHHTFEGLHVRSLVLHETLHGISIGGEAGQPVTHPPHERTAICCRALGRL